MVYCSQSQKLNIFLIKNAYICINVKTLNQLILIATIYQLLSKKIIILADS